MAHKNKRARILLKDIFYSWKSRHDSGVVLHNSIFHRNIEINAHNHTLAFQVNVFYSLYHLKLLCLDYAACMSGKSYSLILIGLSHNFN